MLSTNKVVYAEDTFCYKDPVAKCQNYNIVCNRFNTFFCTKDRKTYQAISNRKFRKKLTLIWVGFLVVRFYRLALSRLRA